MANLKFNGWMKNVRGASGDIVFKRQYDKLVVAQKAKFDPKPPTATQLAHRKRFITAAGYAKSVIDDPVARVPYAEAAKARNTSAFALALRDFMILPTVTEVDLAAYYGKVGDPITVRAEDDFELTLKVTITHANGAVLEQGLATPTFEPGVYVYHATTVAPTNEMLRIEAVAKDRPGRERSLSEEWHA